MKNKIVDLEALIKIVEVYKKQGKRVVATSGCFDIIHAGHVIYLEEAAHKGNILIVFLNSDKSVQSLKGNLRPIVPQNERAKVIAGLESVDYVCIFDEFTPCNMINKIRPNCFVKGGDYEGRWIPEMNSVQLYGGNVEYVKMTDGCSTTNIIEKILEVMKGEMR